MEKNKMNPTLVDNFTQEDRYEHWLKCLQGELLLPFSVTSHAYCFYLLDQCDPKIYLKFQKEIWDRFYNSRKEEQKCLQ